MPSPFSSFTSRLAGQRQEVEDQVTQRLLREEEQRLGQAPETVGTSLADVSLGKALNLSPGNFADTDALIRSRTQPALRLVREGSEEAQRLSELGRQAAIDPLTQFTDLAAFDEQNALLGLSGQQAQEEAISGIPVSQLNQELQRRQRETQLRQAAARGEVGSGATLSEAQQLAGGQQAQNIQRRLAELEPLVAAARGARSTISGIEEQAAARRAQLQSGSGIQQANIRLGTTAPLIESRLQQAELSGLGRIASANQQGQIASQLANVAGTFAPQVESFFNRPEIQGPPVALANFNQFNPAAAAAPAAATNLNLGR